MIPYRARRVLRRIFIVLLVLALITAAVLVCWFLWLNRYIVYTRDGVKLDFNLSQSEPYGETAVPPEPIPTVNIQYGEATTPGDAGPKEFTRFSGYYVTLEDLLTDFDAAQAKLLSLPRGSTVMLDLKSVKSDFYYSTSVGTMTTKLEIPKMDSLIADLKAGGYYLIARIPAFQEYDYILENQAERVPWGLPKVGGNGSLWLDAEGPCYWMNPAKDATLTRLIQIITEIRVLGFDEVVLADYRFPDTDKVAFEGDKDQTLRDVAETLVKTCATDSFCVSFTRSAADLPLPEGRTRLYLTGVSAADAAVLAAQTGFAEPGIHVVFITDAGDTRYDAFCALRPIDQAGGNG